MSRIEPVIKQKVLKKTGTTMTIIFFIRKNQIKFPEYIMRKKGLENLPLTGHSEGYEKRKKTSLGGWMIEERQRGVLKVQKILRTTNDRKLW